MKQTPSCTRFSILASPAVQARRHAALTSLALGLVLAGSALVQPVRAEDTASAPVSVFASDAAFDAAIPGIETPGVDVREVSALSLPEPARPKSRFAIPNLNVENILARHHLSRNGEKCQFGVISSPVPIGIRLGAALSPRVRFDGGVDVTIPGLRVAPGFNTRVDFDAIIAANFHGISTLFPLTIDQIYRIPLPLGSSLYVGGGIGPYFGEVTRFGGKLLIGGTITPRFGLEGTLYFQGIGDPTTAVQARFPF